MTSATSELDPSLRRMMKETTNDQIDKGWRVCMLQLKDRTFEANGGMLESKDYMFESKDCMLNFDTKYALYGTSLWTTFTGP